jgi:hypothetical protein
LEVDLIWDQESRFKTENAGSSPVTLTKKVPGAAWCGCLTVTQEIQTGSIPVGTALSRRGVIGRISPCQGEGFSGFETHLRLIKAGLA